MRQILNRHDQRDRPRSASTKEALRQLHLPSQRSTTPCLTAVRRDSYRGDVATSDNHRPEVPQKPIIEATNEYRGHYDEHSLCNVMTKAE
ncbi:hypothetical protein J6590_106607 [Homalodisca vitripennis]|nr:hypothetical protein J6590_106607 [Homalodisca vitripennis]